jgi:Tol biopolymer transport system component
VIPDFVIPANSERFFTVRADPIDAAGEVQFTVQPTRGSIAFDIGYAILRIIVDLIGPDCGPIATLKTDAAFASRVIAGALPELMNIAAKVEAGNLDVMRDVAKHILRVTDVFAEEVGWSGGALAAGCAKEVAEELASAALESLIVLTWVLKARPLVELLTVYGELWFCAGGECRIGRGLDQVREALRTTLTLDYTPAARSEEDAPLPPIRLPRGLPVAHLQVCDGVVCVIDGETLAVNIPSDGGRNLYFTHRIEAPLGGLEMEWLINGGHASFDPAFPFPGEALQSGVNNVLLRITDPDSSRESTVDAFIDINRVPNAAIRVCDVRTCVSEGQTLDVVLEAGENRDIWIDATGSEDPEKDRLSSVWLINGIEVRSGGDTSDPPFPFPAQVLDNGMNSVHVTVRDPNGGFDLAGALVNVTKAEGNQAPVAKLRICTVTDHCTLEHQTLELGAGSGQLRFYALAEADPNVNLSYDPDSDPLGFEWVINGELYTTSPNFEFDSALLQPGENHVLLRVGDNNAAVTEVGATIFVTGTTGGVRPVITEPTSDLIVASALDEDLASTGLVTVTADGDTSDTLFEGCASSPQWSPDRTKVAFLWMPECLVGEEGIDALARVAVVDADGSEIAVPLEAAGLESGSFGFSWAPDSTQLVADGGERVSPNGPDRHLVIVGLDRASSPFPGPNAVIHEYLETVHESWPVWSPDGTWVIWATGTSSGLSDVHVTVWRADGTGGLTLQGQAVYAWSPDGSRLAMPIIDERDRSWRGVVWNAQEGHDVFGETSPLFTADLSFDRISAIDWAPDGMSLVFSGRQPGDEDEDIWLSRLDGRPPVRLTAQGRFDTDPVFSPDGNEVAFTSYLPFTDHGVYVIDTSGGEPRLLLPNASQPDW